MLNRFVDPPRYEIATRALHGDARTVPGLHLRLRKDPSSCTGGGGHAALLLRHTAERAPDGPGVGQQRSDPPGARSGPQHRTAGGARGPADPALSPPTSTDQNHWGEVLVAALLPLAAWRRGGRACLRRHLRAYLVAVVAPGCVIA